MTIRIQTRLTQDDIEALCDAAAHAWEEASLSATKVRFGWRGSPYVSQITKFNIEIETPGGERVASRMI